MSPAGAQRARGLVAAATFIAVPAAPAGAHGGAGFGDEPEWVDPSVEAFRMSRRFFGGFFFPVGGRATVSAGGRTVSSDRDPTGGQGLFVGYDHPLLPWLSARGLVRGTRWNTAWQEATGYGSAFAIDVDAELRARGYVSGRFALTASIPVGLTIDHRPGEVDRAGYVERAKAAFGYNYSLLGGFEILLRGDRVALTLEGGIRHHAFTHDVETHSNGAFPAPTGEAVHYALDWTIFQTGVTVSW